jgi:hypothetical protein
MPYAAVARRAGDVRRDPAGAHSAEGDSRTHWAVQILTQHVEELTAELGGGEITELRRLVSTVLRTTGIIQKGGMP